MSTSMTIPQWKKIAEDLGLSIEAPYSLSVRDGVILQVPVLVRDFGAVKGMLIVEDYSQISDYQDELIDRGYGYSTMTPEVSSDYDRDSVVSVLSDWSWSGKAEKKPGWLK